MTLLAFGKLLKEPIGCRFVFQTFQHFTRNGQRLIIRIKNHTNSIAFLLPDFLSDFRFNREEKISIAHRHEMVFRNFVTVYCAAHLSPAEWIFLLRTYIGQTRECPTSFPRKFFEKKNFIDQRSFNVFLFQSSIGISPSLNFIALYLEVAEMSVAISSRQVFSCAAEFFK